MASTAGGTLGLVNDLSVKLQKQRKQLNALVKEVKSAQAAELRWASLLPRLLLSCSCDLHTRRSFAPPSARLVPCSLHNRTV